MRELDLMSTPVLTVHTETGLKEAARMMVQAGVSGLPVVDGSDRLVGIITEGDFLKREAERGRPESATGAGNPGDTVAEAMTSDPITIRFDAPLAEAARLLADGGLNRLPVLDDDGAMVGIISRRDVLAVFARPDEVIEDEIREDLVRRILFLEPEEVSITVRDGVVTIQGELPSHSDAQLLEELVRRLEGVVDVKMEVTWQQEGEA